MTEMSGEGRMRMDVRVKEGAPVRRERGVEPACRHRDERNCGRGHRQRIKLRRREEEEGDICTGYDGDHLSTQKDAELSIEWEE